MPVGIRAENCKGLQIIGGSITGFDKGIQAINSDVVVNGTTFRRCNTAIESVNSDMLMYNPVFLDNVIDLVVNKSNAKLINNLTQKIVAITPNNDVRINPYVIQQMGIRVINTRDLNEKKTRLRTLLKYLKNYTHIWAIYSILKEVARLAGYPV